MRPNKNKIVKFLYPLFFLVLHQSCVSQEGSTKNESIKALTLTMTVPMPGQEDSVIKYYNGKKVLFEVTEEGINIFKVPFFHHVSETKVNKDGDYISDQFIRTDTTYYYIIFKSGDKTGLKYDSASQAIGTVIPVDSFMRTATILMLDTFIASKQKNDSLVATVWSSDKLKLTETYIPIKKPDESYSDSTILEYESGLNGYRFSLSNEADKRKKMKLSLVKMIYNKKDQGSTPYSRAERFIAYRIESSDIKADKKGLEQLLRTYKKERLKYKHDK